METVINKVASLIRRDMAGDIDLVCQFVRHFLAQSEGNSSDCGGASERLGVDVGAAGPRGANA